ncbi:MAG: hypothetical protein AB7N76_19895 [Planctomycetota bacterium]
MIRQTLRALSGAALALALFASPALAGQRDCIPIKIERCPPIPCVTPTVKENGDCKPVPELSLLAAGSALALLAGGSLSAFGARRREG